MVAEKVESVEKKISFWVWLAAAQNQQPAKPFLLFSLVAEGETSLEDL